jgi:hypothetical protein
MSNTDYDYFLFFEQMITRIENAINTLELRALAADVPGLSLDCDVADILQYVSRLIAANPLPVPSRQDSQSPISPTATRH